MLVYVSSGKDAGLDHEYKLVDCITIVMCGGTTVALPATVKRVHARTIQLHGAWAYVRGAHVRAHTWVEQYKRQLYIHTKQFLYSLFREEKKKRKLFLFN